MDGIIEIRAGCELRARGRTLSGTVLRYGDVAPLIRERFERGAFGEDLKVPLNLQHDSEIEILPPGGFDLWENPESLELRAELPERSAAVQLVRSGALTGYSVEFYSKAERREDGIRVIEKAELHGIALCNQPHYPQSLAEVRARGSRGGRLFTARGRIPTGKRMECKCAPGKCNAAMFKTGSFDNVTEDESNEILAVVGDYSQALSLPQARRNSDSRMARMERWSLPLTFPTMIAGGVSWKQWRLPM